MLTEKNIRPLFTYLGRGWGKETLCAKKNPCYCIVTIMLAYSPEQYQFANIVFINEHFILHHLSLFQYLHTYCKILEQFAFFQILFSTREQTLHKKNKKKVNFVSRHLLVCHLWSYSSVCQGVNCFFLFWEKKIKHQQQENVLAVNWASKILLIHSTILTNLLKHKHSSFFNHHLINSRDLLLLIKGEKKEK